MLQRKDIKPPVHHARGLGEETVTADVDPVPSEVDGPGDPADLVGGLDHDRVDVSSPKELKSGGEACRPGADDDRCFPVFGHDAGSYLLRDA